MREIWTYSVQQWGRRVAAKYVRELTSAIEAVASDPHLGVAMDDLQCRKQVFRSHVIFYAPAEHRIIVIRVLHQQMDAASRLG